MSSRTAINVMSSFSQGTRALAKKAKLSSTSRSQTSLPTFFNTTKPDPLLVAARGVYAQRAVNTANRHGIPVFALNIPGDTEQLKGDVTMIPVEGHGSAGLLDYNQHVELAQKYGIGAVAVGWGGYSEKPEAIEAYAKQGIFTISPSHNVIRQMGDKVKAKKQAKLAGFDVTKNSAPSEDPNDILTWVNEQNISFPIIIKAQEGGGGKGIRSRHCVNLGPNW